MASLDETGLEQSSRLIKGPGLLATMVVAMFVCVAFVVLVAVADAVLALVIGLCALFLVTGVLSWLFERALGPEELAPSPHAPVRVQTAAPRPRGITAIHGH